MNNSLNFGSSSKISLDIKIMIQPLFSFKEPLVFVLLILIRALLDQAELLQIESCKLWAPKQSFLQVIGQTGLVLGEVSFIAFLD